MKKNDISQKQKLEFKGKIGNEELLVTLVWEEPKIGGF